MNFTTKQEYLDFAATWKADYAKLTKKIRAAKPAYREAQRAFAPHTPFNYHSTPEEFKAYHAAYKHMNNLLEEVDLLRKQAHHAIKIRVQSKEAAQAAYLSSRT